MYSFMKICSNLKCKLFFLSPAQCQRDDMASCQTVCPLLQWTEDSGFPPSFLGWGEGLELSVSEHFPLEDFEFWQVTVGKCCNVSIPVQFTILSWYKYICVCVCVWFISPIWSFFNKLVFFLAICVFKQSVVPHLLWYVSWCTQIYKLYVQRTFAREIIHYGWSNYLFLESVLSS